MTTQFSSPDQRRLFEAVVRQLNGLGYSGELLQTDYAFPDHFSPDLATVTTPAAAFGQTPPDYRSACFAVVLSNGRSGADLIAKYRALGAPRAFEVHPDGVFHWRVSANPAAGIRPQVIKENELGEVFRANADQWGPSRILRDKNIVAPEPRQRDFIDYGLIPALESEVRQKLDPLLREVLAKAKRSFEQRTGREPYYDRLYRLVFRALMGKVMHDRGLEPFASVGNPPDPALLLEQVARHYNDSQPILNDRAVQRLVVEPLWNGLNFMNLSVEVLAFVWENTLVTDDLRQARGIHATPPDIARYLVQHLIDGEPKDDWRIVEPCCGSGTFLTAALQRLRELLKPGIEPHERHRYFAKVLRGFDTETFGLEVARSCLTLADYPNPNGWRLDNEDVFDLPSESPAFTSSLKKARFVLCNPPFENFTGDEQERYDVDFAQKPAEVLSRVLDHLSPTGELGFVLPHQALDGRAYRSLRGRLAERFGDLEIVHLPEGVFAKAKFPSILLLAKNPTPSAASVVVRYSRIHDLDQFVREGKVDRYETTSKTKSEVEASFGIVELSELWEFLSTYPRLSSVAEDIARGVEWEDFKNIQPVSENPLPGYLPGFHKSEEMFCFEPPPVMYLCARKEVRRRNAWDKPWHRPKVVCNAVRKSQGPWRITACPVDLNIICSQNFTVIWPKSPWTAKSLAAVMNGPIACAFVASRERWKHLTKETLENVPVPPMDPEQIDKLGTLVDEYRKLRALRRDFPPEDGLFGSAYPAEGKLIDLLRKIDLEVLRAYNLPPALLDKLTTFFDDYSRPVPFHYEIGSVFGPPRSMTPEEEARERKASRELFKKALRQDRA